MCNSSFYSVAHTPGKQHLDYSGVDFVRVDFTSPRLEGRNIVDGFESMDLSGCALPDRPCWELIGAAGRLQRINLSGTKVTEEGESTLQQSK
jgi:hypothetical protein